MEKDFLNTEEYENYKPKTEKQGFIMYFNFMDDFNELSDSELGVVIRAAYEYAMFGTCESTKDFTDRIQKAIFNRIKNVIDIDNKKYKEKCYLNSLRRKSKDKKKTETSNEIEIYSE